MNNYSLASFIHSLSHSFKDFLSHTVPCKELCWAWGATSSPQLLPLFSQVPLFLSHQLLAAAPKYSACSCLRALGYSSLRYAQGPLPHFIQIYSERLALVPLTKIARSVPSSCFTFLHSTYQLDISHPFIFLLEYKLTLTEASAYCARCCVPSQRLEPCLAHARHWHIC